MPVPCHVMFIHMFKTWPEIKTKQKKSLNVFFFSELARLDILSIVSTE